MKKIDIINHVFVLKALLERSGNVSIFKDFGLSTCLYAPLRMIYEDINEISQMKRLSSESLSSFTQKIQKLEKLGLIERILDAEDKRKWKFFLTHKGLSILTQVEERYESALDHLFQEFSPQEQACFSNGIQKLLKSVNQKK